LDRDAPLIDVWKCDSRYFRRHFIEKIKHHTTAFIASPGHDHVNTRLLYEHSTGYNTGAVESNNSLLSVFNGEFACGQRMGLIHVRSTSAKITLTRGITPAVRLPLHGRRKCLRGMIRGFTRAVILVHDPFVAIWNSYISSRRIDVSSLQNNSILINKEDWKVSAIDIARRFNDSMLNIDEVYRRMTELFNETNIFAVSHASLIYIESEGKRATSLQIHRNLIHRDLNAVTHHGGHNKVSSFQNSISGLDRLYGRYKTLMDMISFTGYQDHVTVSRLLCAYSFINIADELHSLDIMIDHYKLDGASDLICEIKNILDKKFDSTIKIRHIFYDFPCLKMNIF
jgi:hypothetical protein